MLGLLGVAVGWTADEVAVSRGAHSWTSVDVSVPELPVHSVGLACRFHLQWTASGMVAEQVSSCDGAVAPLAAQAVATWRWTATPGAPIGHVAELWLIPPRRPGLSSHVSFVQDANATLRLPAAIDVVPFHVVGRSFLTWPEAAKDGDTSDTSCDVRVEVSQTGIVGAVDAEGCDDLFRDAAEVGLRRWGMTPWALDGLSVPSAVRLVVEFRRAVDDAPDPYGVNVRFPRDPDRPDAQVARVDSAPPQRPQPPMPEGSPAFLVHEPPYARIAVHEYPLPAARSEPGRCDAMVGVNSRRQVWVWIAESCEEPLRAPVEEALQQWVLVPQSPQGGEIYARVSLSVVFPGNDAPPTIELLDPVYRAKELAAGVHTVPAPRVLKRTVPAGMADGSCTLEVVVGTDGRPKAATPVVCDDALRAAALEAVQQWRWDPPRADGRPSEWTTRVRIRSGG